MRLEGRSVGLRAQLRKASQSFNSITCRDDPMLVMQTL